MPTEKLLIKHKNSLIEGTLRLPRGDGPHQLIILCHGFMSRAAHLFPFTYYFTRRGFATFNFDFFGHGRRREPLEKLSIKTELEELGAVFNHLRRRKDIGSIGIFGMSLGGLIAALYCAKNSRVKSLVLLSPVVDFEDVVKNLLGESGLEAWKRDGYAVFDRSLSFRGHRVGYAFFKEGQKIDTLSAAGRIRCPCLILQGGADRKTKARYIAGFYKRIPCPKKIYLMMEARHGLLNVSHFLRVCRESAGWFASTLR